MKSIKKWLGYLSLLLLSGCTSTLHNVQHKYVPVHQGHIEYYELGKGSPIVLIPGYASDVSFWNEDLLADLAKRHQLFLLNNRNVGGSFVESKNYEIRNLSSDTYQFIQALHLHKPIVAGLSMGGMIAQQLAISHPNAVGTLILLNTTIAGKNAVRPSREVQQDLINMPYNEIGRYILGIELLFPNRWKFNMAYALAFDGFYPEGYIDMNPSAFIPQQQHLIKNWMGNNAEVKQLTKLNLPVLVLCGDADIIMPPENSYMLARTIPNAKLDCWKEGGHGMIYQYPKQIAKAINQFIDDKNHVKG